MSLIIWQADCDGLRQRYVRGCHRIRWNEHDGQGNVPRISQTC